MVRLNQEVSLSIPCFPGVSGYQPQSALGRMPTLSMIMHYDNARTPLTPGEQQQ